MKKSNIRFGIVLAVLLIIYHLLVFAIPFEHNSIFWLSYGLTLDAFVIATVACFIAFRNGKSVTSKFYGFPIAKVGVIYLVVQMILCMAFVVISQYIEVPIWISVLVYAIALGVAVIGLATTDTVRDHIEQQDAKQQYNVSVMRAVHAKVRQMVAQCTNPDCANVVNALAEELRYSDPVSNPALAVIESDLGNAIDELQLAVTSGDDASIQSLCQKATVILNERNILCRISKKKM